MFGNQRKSLLCVIGCTTVIWMLINLGAVSGDSARRVTELLEQIENQHKKTKSLAVRFKQRKYFSFMDEPIISEGRMLFAAPGKIRFELISPYRSLLINDGKSVRRFEFSDNQWQRIMFGAGKTIRLLTDQMAQWVQGRFSEEKSLFYFSHSLDPNSYAVLVLKPREKTFRESVESIHIHVGNPPELKIEQIDIREPGGDNTSMQFYDEHINVSIPAMVFQDPNSQEECQAVFVTAEQDGP